MPPRSRPYNKFMVDYGIGADSQLREVRPDQRWVWVAGVLALAAQSPIRGHLLSAKAQPITEKHVADSADVGPTMAHNALAAFRDLELILADAELSCEYVPNFKIYNPDPPSDSKEGERQRQRAHRARQKRLDLLEKAA